MTIITLPGWEKVQARDRDLYHRGPEAGECVGCHWCDAPPPLFTQKRLIARLEQAERTGRERGAA